MDCIVSFILRWLFRKIIVNSNILTTSYLQLRYLQSGTPFVDLAQMTAAADFFIFQAHLLDENCSSICLKNKSVREIT